VAFSDALGPAFQAGLSGLKDRIGGTSTATRPAEVVIGNSGGSPRAGPRAS